MFAQLRPSPWVAVLLALTLPSAAGAQTQRALRFESSVTPRYVTFGAAPSLGCSTLTVEVRFKRTSPSSVGITASTGTGGINAAPLVTKGRGEADNSNLDCNFFVGLDAAGRVAVDYEEGAGQTSPGLNHPMFSHTAVTDTLWHHAAVTFDGSATGTMRIYLDGILDSTKVVGAKRLPRWDSIQHAGLATAMTSAGAASGNFQGILDEARIWGVARTDQQIADNMNAEILQGAGLLGRWGLSEGSGLSAGNSVANGVGGTLTNGPLWTTDSTLPQLTATGLRFGGSNAYVTFGNPAALGASTFTVETWFRLDGLGRSTTTGGGGLARAIPLVTKGRGESDGSNVDMNYFLGVDSTTTKLVADFEDAASGANHPVTGSTTLSSGVWYHAAATFDGSTFRLYLNGTLEGSASTTATPRFDSIQHAGLGTALNSTGVADGFLNGALDEARIWTVARSQSEIVAAMNSELTGPVTGLAARWGMNEDGLATVASSAGGTVNGTITGSSWAWASGAPFDAAPPSIPADPSGLTATVVSTSRLDLVWTDNANNEGSYEVERSTTGIGGSYSLLISLPANSTGYSNTGLTSGTEYCYRVRAVNGVGPSGYAGPTCATTATPTPPAAPSGLVATAPTSGQVHLVWSDNSLDETSFELERSTTGSGGPFSLLATLVANTTTYEDLNREPGTEYCYRVRAVNADGASGDAGPSCVTTPAATARALDLTGGSYARFGNPAELRLTAFTIEMWLRRDGAGSGTNTGTGGIPDAIPLVAKGRAEAENAFQDINYLFGIRASDGVLCADFEEGSGGASPSLNHPIAGVTPIPATGVWHHVAATYDGATWNLYLDGNLDATLAVNRPAAAACSVSVALGSALTSAGVAAGSFDGAFDEVRIWNVARTQAEIRAAANAQLAVATPGLAARWSLDEGAGTTLNGSAGTQVAGSLLGGSSTWISPAPFGLVFAPDAPSGLAANAPTSTRVNLSWTDNAVNEASYELERSTTGVGGTYALLATLAANSTSYADTLLTPSTEYCYRVRAVNAGGTSAYAGPACATTLVQTYTLTYTAGPNGTIVGTTPQTVDYNTSGSLVTATPNTGYHFVTWSDGVLTAARTDASVIADLSVTASFAINTYTLTYTAAANGTIVGTSPQTVGYNTSGSLVTATPDTGYHFVTWSDGVLTAARTDANVTANLSVTASFAINTYTLTYTAGANGTIVGTTPQVVDYNTSGSLVTATPNTGYHFVTWSDGVLTAARTDASIIANLSVTASFAINTYTLTYTAAANGTIVGTSPQTVGYNTSGSLVTATPNTGYHFVSWSDGVLTAARTDASVIADLSVTATFAINTYTLTYTAGPNGTIVGVTSQTVDYNGSGSLVTATPNTAYHFVSWSDGVLTAARTDAGIIADLSVTASFAINTYTLTYTAGPNGTIVGVTPQTVDYNTSGSLVTATPNTGYHFVTWSDGVLTAARTDASVIADLSVTASFAINTYTLTVAVDPDGSGSVARNPDQPSYDHGGTVQLTAVPAAGYTFVNWSGDATGSANPISVTMDGAKSVTAHFVLNAYTIAISVAPVGSGSVAKSPDQAAYDIGSSVDLMASAATGYHFVDWTGDLTGSTNPQSLTMDADKGVTAHFAINTYTLTYAAGPNGTIVGTTPQTVDYNTSGSLVTATPNTGYHFVSWSDGVLTAARTDANVTDNLSVTASFAINTYTLTYTAAANGTIVGTTPQTVGYNTSGSLVTATPNTGYHFVTWSDGVLTAARTDASVIADLSVTASFAINTYTLTYTAGPNGTIVGTSPQTVDYNGSGSLVTATPSTGYHFVTWSDGVLTAARTDANVTANLSVTATFAINTYTLTYAAGPNGTIVGVTPQTVDYNTSGSLVTATPNTGYHFVSWSDGVLTAARTDASVIADLSVTATFAINTYTLTYTAGPNGTIVGTSPQTVGYNTSGSLVTATPNTGYHFVSWSDGVLTAARTDTGIIADLSVTASFAINTYTLAYAAGPNGTIVGTTPQTVDYNTSGSLVTATPNTGYHFVSWSDGILTAARTDASVIANLSVTASFAINTYTLTYTAAANGTIVGTTPQTVGYNTSGSLVTATPNTGYHFVSWSDGVLTAARTDVNVIADLSVTASFAINTYTLTYAAGPNGTIVGVTPQTVDYNTSGSLVTATPNTGYHFVTWSDGVLTAARTDAGVIADLSVTASFAINTYTLTYTAAANGTIVGTSPQTVDYNTSGSLVTATPNTGYHFVTWSDGILTAARTDAGVTGDLSVTASFAINTYTLTYTAAANGTIVGTTPQTVGYNTSGSLVTATPNTGYHFVTWSDGLLTAARTDAGVIADLSVTASFAINTYTLTYTAGPNGTIVGTTPQTVDYNTSGSLVTATPNTGYHFVTWSDGILTAARTDANVIANLSVTASFAINTYTLAYTAGANGTIVGTTPQTVGYNTSGSLVTATPNTGYHFVSWSDGVLTAARTDASVTADLSVTASFAINTYTLTYTAGPNGTIVGTTPQTVDYNTSGSPVTATPNTGYHFVSWSDGVLTAARTDANVATDINVTASFAINPDALSFAGTNAYVNLGNPAALQLPAFTLEMWLRRDGTGAGTNTGTGGIPDLVPLIGKGRAEAEDPLKDINYILGISASTGVLAADFEEAAAPSPNPSLNHPVLGATPITIGSWYHVAATYDGSAWRLYVNGTLDAQLAVGRAPASTSNVPVALASALSSTSVAAGFFNGVLDEVRVWSTARSAGEIAQTMNSRLDTPTPGLVGRWGLDEGTGTVAGSTAGTPLDGAITGTGWAWAPGAPFNNSTFTINASASAGGTIAPAGLVVLGPGNSQAFTITPDACHDIADVVVDGFSQGTVGSYTFTSVGADHTIAASFALKTFTITATAGTGGSISPLGATPVGCGADQSYDITPDTGYHVADVLVDGASVGAVVTYTFSGVSAGHTIAGSFARNGDALAFTGTNGYVNLGNPVDLSLAAFTLEMWMRREGPGVGGDTGAGGIPNLIPLLAKGRAESEDPLKDVNYALGIRASDGVLAADFEEAAAPSPNPSLNHPVLGVTPLAVGTWYHVAATYDGATWRLYVDGSLDAELAVGRAPASASTVAVALASMLNSTGTAAGFFQGTMDEVRVWNAARTQADIIAAMNSRITTPTAGLVARWGLDEGSGSIVHSSAGAILDGTLAGTGWSWATGAPFDATPPTAPAPPTALQATGALSQVSLAWTDNANNETGFEIERSTSGSAGPFSPLTSVGPDVVTYNDTGLSAGSEYCYRVRAVNAIGNSSYEGPVCATTLTAPTHALSFGGNTYVTFGDPAALDLPQFTLECWFRRDGAGATTSTGSGGVTDAIPLVTHGTSQSDGSNVDMNFFLGIKSSTGVLCADFEEGAGGSTPGLNHPILGTTPIVTGTWYHAAATYDGATWRLYLNGNPEAQLAVGQPVQSGSIQHAALAASITSTGTAQGYFVGVLDEARIWSTVRSQAEIQASANSQIAASQAGLAARWSLDEGSGAAVNGSAGTSVNGSIIGTSYAWVGPAPFNLSFTPPADPASLTATASSFTQIDLAWTDNSGNESAFEIERSTSGPGGAYTPLATVGANTTSYPDVGLAPSTEYCYRVRAVNGSGVSGYAGPICATTPVATSTALDLAGNTFVNFGDNATLHLQTFTIEMWLRRDGAGVGTNTGTGGIADAIPLVAKGRADAEDPTRDINYLFGIQAATGVLCADFEEGAAGTSPSLNHPVLGATPITTGGWHHVAATYDGESWSLYLDGIPDGTLTVGQPPAAGSIAPVAIGSALTTAVGAAGFFDGAVDEVRVWSVARTLQEIQSTANARISTATTGLVARWSLDESAGTTVGGSAGTTINGVISGTAYSWIGGAPFNLSFNLPPAQPVVVSPSHNATNVTTSPTLAVTVSDPDGQPVTVDFHGRSTTSAAGPDFTIIGVPDTQYYSGELNGGTNAIFQSQTNWMVLNRASRNIVYVATLGDCVEHGDNAGNDIEWQRANTSLSILENPLTTGLPAGFPYGVTVGNHDQSPNGNPDGATTTFYNQYFGESRFLGRPYYGGHYGTNNDNWYDLFSADGMDFIVISLEYDPTPDAAILAWADNLLTTYSSRRAILLSHFFANTGNPATFGAQGQATYDALKGHSNLFLMLCGHVPGEGRRQDTFGGNTVNTLMSDYQSRTNGGNGWLRIMEFSPANNVIRVKTYSPWLDQFEADADSSSQFTLLYNMSTTTPYALLGSVAGVASGSNASLVWPGLQGSTAYEWYATVSDGATTTTGPVWRFTTTAGATYALTTAADPPAGGTVTRNPVDPTYPSGTSVTLTAVPSAGYEFRGWCGDASGPTNPTTVDMTLDKAVTAIFNETGAPMVQVTSPNGGQIMQRGSLVEIHWTAEDAEGIDLVDVLLSRDGPNGPWETLGSDLSGATSFTWVATGPSTSRGFVRVVAHNPSSAIPSLTGWDLSDASFTITDVVTGVDEQPVTQFALRVASSNPMTDRAAIAFALPHEAEVRVDVLDVQGRRVANVVNRRYPAGRWTVNWMGRSADGTAVASGVYFLRFRTPDRVVTKRFALVR